MGEAKRVLGMISVLVPVYGEGEQLVDWLRDLFERHEIAECIVIDASDKEDFELVKDKVEHQLKQANLQYLAARRKGRAAQMNQGAKLSQHDIILFLHADTILPGRALSNIQISLDEGACWGRFDVRFDDESWPYRMIANMMNWRSRITGIATGDQAMFMTRAAYIEVGGFDEIPLMEDISMSKKLKALGAPACLSARVKTASRRWQTNGVIRTIVLMWWLRLAYFMGVPVTKLAKWYR